MRAGDDQHGDRTHHRLAEVAEHGPHQQGDHCGGGGDVEQPGGEAVGQHLGPTAGLLCLRHQSLDAGERGVVAERVDAYPKGCVGGDGAGHHPITGRPRHRPGLAGDHRLVHLGLAVEDLTVRRHPCTGPYQHGVAHAQVGHRHPLGPTVVGEPFRVVGQQCGKRRQGTLRLADRLHLLPVAEQHDGDQRRQLPPEVQVERAERGGQRRQVGDGDRHRDQQHHAGGPVADLAHRPLEKGPATVREHHRAQHRSHQADPGEVQLVAEPVHHHVAGDHDRHGQRQAQPELAPERLRIVPRMLVMPPVPAMLPGRHSQVAAGSGFRAVVAVSVRCHIIPPPSHDIPLGGIEVG